MNSDHRAANRIVGVVFLGVLAVAASPGTSPAAPQSLETDHVRLFPTLSENSETTQGIFNPATCESVAECDDVRIRAALKSTLLRDASSTPVSMLTRIRAGDGRSVPLAFALSAAVPGAGQAYNRQWIKAAAGIVIEAAVITSWQLLRSKGLDEEDQFRAVAHSDWDPLKYAAWLNDYSEFLQAEHGATVSATPVVPASDVDFRHPDSWSAADQQESARMFAEIHVLEKEMFHPETGATFSHRLPTFGDQQYYELIGKYFQFAPGWDDYPDWIAGDGSFTSAIDPELSGPGGEKPNVSPTFFSYARDHAHAQDVLRTATRVSLLLIVNHLMAAIDAAVTSKLHNDRLSTSMGFARVGDGAAGPTASVSLRF